VGRPAPLLVEQIELARFAGCPGMFLVRARRPRASTTRQCGLPRSAEDPRGRREPQPHGCGCAARDRESHAPLGGRDAPGWRATSGGRRPDSRRTDGRPPQFSGANGPIPRFLPERLNERAKWISRGIRNPMSPFWIVETISPRASEIERGNIVRMGAKKTPTVSRDRKRPAVKIRRRFRVRARFRFHAAPCCPNSVAASSTS
jgi:hypothetical protein